jgi:hypothetical protein
VARCADQLAARLTFGESSFGAARQQAQPEYSALLDAVTRRDARFAFDREGRPAANGAVREALPDMERDHFEAVLEDHACELAAVEEALYQLAMSLARERK